MMKFPRPSPSVFAIKTGGIGGLGTRLLFYIALTIKLDIHNQALIFTATAAVVVHTAAK